MTIRAQLQRAQADRRRRVDPNTQSPRSAVRSHETAVLQLQRQAGNRAVGELIRASRDTAVPPVTVQRHHSITRIPHRRLFKNHGSPEFAAQRARIRRYAKVQRFLSNPAQTKPMLHRLNRALVAEPLESLSNILRRAEGGADPQGLVQLVEALGRDDFSDIVREGIRFEDWVGQTHGTQTHRIQWWMIGQKFDDADALYRNAVDPVLDPAAGFGTTMWDLVVDAGEASHRWDFTKPETLQTYLRERYRPGYRRLLDRLNGAREANRLGGSIRNEEAGFVASKQGFLGARPTLFQDNEPGLIETEVGSWTGWKSANQYTDEGVRERVWSPTVLIPAPPPVLVDL